MSAVSKAIATRATPHNVTHKTLFMSPLRSLHSSSSVSAPDTDATVSLPAQYVAVQAIMLWRQISNPHHAACALNVQALSKMEDTLNDQILHLEQQIARLRANLPEELEIICRMTSCLRRRLCYGRYDKFAALEVQETKQKIAQIQLDINKLKAGLCKD
jgi:uncharacterized small protein (DUF1192 family)